MSMIETAEVDDRDSMMMIRTDDDSDWNLLKAFIFHSAIVWDSLIVALLKRNMIYIVCLLIKSPTICLSICFHIDRYLVGVFLFANFNAAILHISAFLKVIVINTFRKKGSTWE